MRKLHLTAMLMLLLVIGANASEIKKHKPQPVPAPVAPPVQVLTDTEVLKLAVANRQVVPAGTYHLTETLYLGDGASDRVSTIQNGFLRGQGGFSPAAWMLPDGATIIAWEGPSDQPAIEVRGPIAGVVLEGFILILKGDKASGIKCRNACELTIKDVTINGGGGPAVDICSTPVTAIPYFIAHNTRLDRIVVASVVPGASGLLLGSEGNFCQALITNCRFRFNGGGPTCEGIVLRFADSLTIVQTLVAVDGDRGLVAAPLVSQPCYPLNIAVYNSAITGAVVDTRDMIWTPPNNWGIYFDVYPTSDGEALPVSHPGFWGTTDARRRFGWQ